MKPQVKAPHGVGTNKTMVGSFLVLTLLLGAQADTLPAQTLATEEAKTLYTLGVSLARSTTLFGLSGQELEIVKRGLSDGVLKRQLSVEPKTYLPKVSALARERGARMREQQRIAGMAFLTAVAKKPGVKKSVGGAVSEVLQPGLGEPPSQTDSVSVTLVGKDIDGHVFDNSEEPIVFSVSNTLRCWKEVLVEMRPGERRKVVCPPELTFGDMNGPQGTKPAATLIYEIALIKIFKKEATTDLK